MTMPPASAWATKVSRFASMLLASRFVAVELDDLGQARTAVRIANLGEVAITRDIFGFREPYLKNVPDDGEDPCVEKHSV
jgi:hypothetical protein